MLALTAPLLAALLGQTCPTPSPYDPPPCAAARVPGCLPGYRPQYDHTGRLIYVCNSLPTQPRPVLQVVPAPQPAQVAVAPAPPAVTAPAPPEESRGHVGLVLTPGVAAFPSSAGYAWDQTKPVGQIGLEFRGSDGGARVRFSAEYTNFGRIGELSFKYDFFDGFFFRPFLSVGLGIASINPDPGLRAAGSASGGVDLYITRDFFLTGELKGTVFTQGTQGPAHGLAISDRKQITALVGLGFYFF